VQKKKKNRLFGLCCDPASLLLWKRDLSGTAHQKGQLLTFMRVTGVLCFRQFSIIG